jgi:hypothetical protein
MDDDEVALLHGPAESAHREMSEAMVNIRATVAQAVSARVICPDAAERVIRSAKNTFYQERSIAAAIDAAWAHDRGAEERKKLLRYIANGGYVNQKRLDAVTLLEHLAGRGIPRAAVASSVHRTSFITKLHFDTVCAPFDVHAADLPKDELVALEARALGRFYPLLCRLARLMAAVHALDFDGDSRARSRLARIRATVDAHEHKHGTRAVARARARHMVNLMRLDDGYRRLRDARGGNREVELYRKSAALWAVIHDHLEQNRVGLPGTLQTLSDDFRRRRGLGRRDATFAWRRANDLDGRGYDRIVAMEARLAMVTSGAQAHALGLRPATDPACWLIDAIRWSGLYSRLEKRIAGTTARNPDLPVASVCKNSAPPGSRKSRRRSS